VKKPKPVAPVVAFTLPAPNDDIHAWGGALRHLRAAKEEDGKIISGRPLFWQPTESLGVDEQWLPSQRLQELCTQDEQLKTLLIKAARAGYSPGILKRVEDRVLQIFEQQLLPEMISKFYLISNTVANYFVAQYAHQQVFPEPPDATPTELLFRA
jgi:hypothetical protein